MTQHIHKKESNQIQQVVKWLEELLAERKDGNPSHHLQSVAVVNTYVPFTSAGGYMTIVLCAHLEHETTVEIVQELAEPPTREQEVPGGE